MRNSFPPVVMWTCATGATSVSSTMTVSGSEGVLEYSGSVQLSSAVLKLLYLAERDVGSIELHRVKGSCHHG